MRFAPPFIAIGWMLAAGLPAEEPANPEVPAELDPALSVDELVERLADEGFHVREAASRAIWEIGDASLPALRQAAKSRDPEQAHRARELLKKIELHITPTTDPVVIALVELYSKSIASRKQELMDQLRQRGAYRQMLKLYSTEKNPDTRANLQATIEGVALIAARERLVAGDPAGAKDFLEMAPVTAANLVALAAFHRAQGTLEEELARAASLDGPKGAAWRLALHRVAGNAAEARKEAEAADNSRVAAAMALFLGDPIPWLRQNGPGHESTGAHELYPELAIRRWQGRNLAAADFEPFRRMLDRGDQGDRWMGAMSLTLLGKHADAEKRQAKDSPLLAFAHFGLMERVPEALRALGLDPEAPDYIGWVAERVGQLSEVPEDEGEHTKGFEELMTLAEFLEKRGLHEEAYAAFGPPLMETAADNLSRFSDLLEGLFSAEAIVLALRIGAEWAGDLLDQRWDEVVRAAFASFGEDETLAEWWRWTEELQPHSPPRDRLAGLLALYDLGVDPQNLRQQWLDRVWEFIEETPADERGPYLARVLHLTTRSPDAKTSLKAIKLAGDRSGGEETGISRVGLLTATDQWDEAAAIIVRLIGSSESFAAANPHFHAYAAAFLRRAGKVKEAAIHDEWAEKLALGSPDTSLQIALAYNTGRDYEREALWLARAAHEADPDSEIFTSYDRSGIGALKSYADSLLERRQWPAASATSEAVAMIAGSAENARKPLITLMHLRMQADFARAMSMLGSDREAAVALLAECHRTFVQDGTLADHFFPALREAGLIREHDEWFEISWKRINETIARFPASDNTLNTAGWLASRAVRRLDEAAKLQREALRINPNQAAYLDTMAEIEFARGDREEAVRWAEVAVNFAPHDKMIREQYHRFLHAPLPQ